jgi:hypothetical protein
VVKAEEPVLRDGTSIDMALLEESLQCWKYLALIFKLLTIVLLQPAPDFLWNQKLMRESF